MGEKKIPLFSKKSKKSMIDLIAQTVLPYIFHSKSLNAVLCAIGILGVSYGMFSKNNLVFIIGLLFIIGGYLLVRRKLKQHIRNFQ
jgi:hypothetical protein